MPQFFSVALPVEEYVEHGGPSLTMKGHTILSLSLLQSPDSQQSFPLLQRQKIMISSNIIGLFGYFKGMFLFKSKQFASMLMLN